jgi:eukaryotic-like serine/threonine-protein kinase
MSRHAPPDGAEGRDVAEVTLTLDDGLPRPPRQASAPAGEVGPGTRVHRYLVKERIGAGGMAVVFLAEDTSLERQVALKFLHFGPLARSPDRAERIWREAQVMARLAHPNIATVYDVGTYHGQVFIAMPYVEGGTLEARLREAADWREAWRLLRGAGEGLAAAHRAGIIHRDFKPANVLVTGDDVPIVTDFGIAKALSEAPTDDDGDDDDDDPGAEAPEETISKTVGRAGTPRYMAPEQHQGTAATPRSDQFSFCFVVYEAVYGEAPFAGDDVAALAESVLTGQRRRVPDQPRVPRWFRRALDRGLSVAPDDRFPSMEELLRALGRDPGARVRRWSAIAAVGVTGALVVGYGLSERQPAVRCGDGQAAIEQAWNQDASARVRASFAATGVPYAEDAWRSVGSILDDHAQAWRAGHLDACQATYERREQSESLFDLRMLCLDRRRAELAALVDIFAEAVDPDLVRRAVDAASGLPPISACADGEALVARAPPPADPAQRARLTAFEQRLSALEAKILAGLYTEVVADGSELLAESADAGHPLLRAEILFAIGRAQWYALELVDAEQTLLSAARAAAETGDAALEARIWAGVLGAAGNRDGDPARLELLLQMAEIAFARAPASPAAAGNFHNQAGMVRSGQGRYAEALDHFDRALASYREHFGDEHSTAATAMQNMAVAKVALGRQDEAYQLLLDALALRERVQGASHPSVAAVLIALADIEDERGERHKAIERFERAIAIRTESFGEDSASLSLPLRGLAWTLAHVGDFDRAITTMRRAVAMEEAEHGPDHPELASSYDYMGAVLARAGRLDEAEVELERSLAIEVRVHGPDHLFAMQKRLNLGILMNLKSDHARAERECGQGLGYLLRTDAAPMYVPYAQACHGVSLEGLGRHRQAQEVLERAVAGLEAAQADPANLGEARFALARALWALGRERPRALELAESAAAAYDASESHDAAKAADVRAWLAAHRQ